MAVWCPPGRGRDRRARRRQSPGLDRARERLQDLGHQRRLPFARGQLQDHVGLGVGKPEQRGYGAPGLVLHHGCEVGEPALVLAVVRVVERVVVVVVEDRGGSVFRIGNIFRAADSRGVGGPLLP